MLIGNHSSQLAYDGVMVATGYEPARSLRETVRAMRPWRTGDRLGSATDGP